MESSPAAPITGLRASLVPMGPLFTLRWQVVKQNAASYKVFLTKMIFPKNLQEIEFVDIGPGGHWRDTWRLINMILVCFVMDNLA